MLANFFIITNHLHHQQGEGVYALTQKLCKVGRFLARGPWRRCGCAQPGVGYARGCLICLRKATAAPTFWPDNTPLRTHDTIDTIPLRPLSSDRYTSRVTTTSTRTHLPSFYLPQRIPPAVSTPHLEQQPAQAQQSTHHGRLYLEVLVADLGEEGDTDTHSWTCKGFE